MYYSTAGNSSQEMHRSFIFEQSLTPNPLKGSAFYNTVSLKGQSPEKRLLFWLVSGSVLETLLVEMSVFSPI